MQAVLVKPSDKSATDTVYRRAGELYKMPQRDPLGVPQPAAVGELIVILDIAAIQDVDRPTGGDEGFRQQPIVRPDTAIAKQMR
jgi:hypothetical protein